MSQNIIPRHLRGSGGHGLNRRSSRPQRRWAVDNVGPEGYAHLLTDKDRAWLEQFNEEYYNSQTRYLNSPRALHNSQELRRSVYRDKNYAERDMYSLGRMVLGHPVYEVLAEGSIPEDRAE